MAPRATIPFLVTMMLITGACNTLLTKYQDNLCVRNCDDPDSSKHKTFEQPVWQTANMFIGEAWCWLIVGAGALVRRFNRRGAKPAYDSVADDEADTASDAGDAGVEPEDVRKPLKGSGALLLIIPASFDILGTTLMGAGLLFIAASIYQMTRAAMVLWVALFSALFLKSHIPLHKWLALVLVVVGVAVVGLAGVLESKPTVDEIGEDTLSQFGESSRLYARAASGHDATLLTITGILLVFLAQIFGAAQFVTEEAVVKRYSSPTTVLVGWEGVFGFLLTVIAMAVAHLVYGRTPHGAGGYFDLRQGAKDMFQSDHRVWITSIAIMFTIACFNYYGMSVTRSVSSTARATIDTCRTLLIWIVSLALRWESFKWLQVLGFVLLVYGTFVFNGLARFPAQERWSRAPAGRPRTLSAGSASAVPAGFAGGVLADEDIVGAASGHGHAQRYRDDPDAE